MSLLPKLRAAQWRNLTILTALVLAVNALGWYWLRGPVQSLQQPLTIKGSISGLAYSPYSRWNAPSDPEKPDIQLIERDLAQLSRLTRHIRVYGINKSPELPAIAARYGMSVTLGIWLGGDDSSDLAEMNGAVKIARLDKNVTRLIVGNEMLLKQKMTQAQLVSAIRQVRSQVKLPVSTAEPWNVWLDHPQLANEVDFITIHLLPYWEGIAQFNAVGHALFQLDQLRLKFPGKPVVIGEIGWPSEGVAIKEAQASPAAQAAFVREFIQVAADRSLDSGRDYFLMEAIDQPWKQYEEGRAGAYWGLFDATRNPKFTFSEAIYRDPFWLRKLVVSSVVGTLLLLLTLPRIRSLKTRAQLVFALTAQLAISLVIAMGLEPLTRYMHLIDWVGLTLLSPVLLLLVAIVFAQAFEFVELFWHDHLRRRFTVLPKPSAAEQPFVSIHLACCNEPPEMVIATIKSLMQLDYARFEVLVIDNNTADASLWQPVQGFVNAAAGNIRFFHLPAWPGFKAGALNFALGHTHAGAKLIAVIDADYVVSPQWLNSIVGHFENPSVGFVQLPQAHRDGGQSPFARLANWEYEGFFRIGMHHRNERNAIIQHGTMTIVRKDALVHCGSWSEWCICEDAELGLRLIGAGYEAVYLDVILGQGLVPANFAAFRRQRMRWAQGGMQILKTHWRSLLLGQKQPELPQLNLAQRYHFVAGWLGWLGDAAHALFTIAALIASAAYLYFPERFSPTLSFYAFPLAIFFVVKLVMGPLLYWRRVQCRFSDCLLASLAGMGLVHAIAVGTFKGLFLKRAVFEVTPKGVQASGQKMSAKNTHQSRRTIYRLPAVFRTNIQEWVALILLLGAGFAVMSSPAIALSDRTLWFTLIFAQSLPYLASIVCGALSLNTAQVQPSLPKQTV